MSARLFGTAALPHQKPALAQVQIWLRFSELMNIGAFGAGLEPGLPTPKP